MLTPHMHFGFRTQKEVNSHGGFWANVEVEKFDFPFFRHYLVLEVRPRLLLCARITESPSVHFIRVRKRLVNTIHMCRSHHTSCICNALTPSFNDVNTRAALVKYKAPTGKKTLLFGVRFHCVCADEFVRHSS